MHSVTQFKKMEKMIVETLKQDFDDVNILKVHIHRDVDSDGDEVLRINVIFEGAPKDVDARKLAGAVRSVRPRLVEEFKERAFPLFSFISKGDAAGQNQFEPA